MCIWTIASSSNKNCLAVVDGLGQFKDFGPHYSRRTPGSKTFTGVGQELVLLTTDQKAVWAVVRQKTPMKRGSGNSRGRIGVTDNSSQYVWRNMLFRNLGDLLSSKLIKFAVAYTYRLWPHKYGNFPVERLRTEICPSKIRSSNPGCCYKLAGFHNSRVVRGKIYLDAPCLTRVKTGKCDCCIKSSWTDKDTEQILYLWDLE